MARPITRKSRQNTNAAPAGTPAAGALMPIGAALAAHETGGERDETGA